MALSISDVITKIQEEVTEKPLCTSYYSFLVKEYGLETKETSVILMRNILSYMMCPKDVWKPFSPFMTMQERRSAIPEDINDEQLSLLEAEYSSVVEPEIKARVADVLWLRRRNVQYAHDAIAAYIESAKNIRSESWTHSIKRIERALRLSLSLKKGGEKDYEDCISYVREILGSVDFERDGFFPLKITELLFDIGFDDVACCISVLEAGVEFFGQKDDFYKKEHYLEVLASWLDRSGDKEQAKAKRVLIAESFVDSVNLEDSAMGKARTLEKAIQIYREIGGSRERIDEIHGLLLQIQKGIPDEMQRMELPPVDVSRAAQRAVKQVSGYTLREALLRFCLVTKSMNAADSFDFVEEQSKRFIHMSITGTRFVDSDGKPVAHVAPLNHDEGPREVSLYPYFTEHISKSFDYSVDASILPALRQIMLEHNLCEDDLVEFVKNNQLIRRGHEHLFVQGLMFGFQEKWDVAASILLPQFEDSLRFLLTQRGKITSSIEDDFTQEERSLNTFFKKNEVDLKEIFGDDIFYELKVLLVRDEDGNGINLRNLALHGLMSQREFFSAGIIYFWWLLFRLIATPLIRERFSEETGEVNGESEHE